MESVHASPVGGGTGAGGGGGIGAGGGTGAGGWPVVLKVLLDDLAVKPVMEEMAR